VLRCDVLAVGTELLLGQIIDSNSAWMGGELAANGIDSLVQVKVGDNVTRIETQLRRLLDDADARAEMAAAARTMARPDAAEVIARDVLALADRYRTN